MNVTRRAPFFLIVGLIMCVDRAQETARRSRKGVPVNSVAIRPKGGNA
jgi:hypothetical protein